LNDRGRRPLLKPASESGRQGRCHLLPWRQPATRLPGTPTAEAPAMSADLPSREQLLEDYLAQLPYPTYPVQEEALYAWFDDRPGVRACPPPATGKPLTPQPPLYEALRTGKAAYYPTPLIALTEQKSREMQEQAVRWGFPPDDVGLVTGNRRVN